MPIYVHWFAIEFLKVLNSAKSQLSNKTLSAMMKFNVATETFVFDISLLETASDAIKEACAMKSTTVDSVASWQGVLAEPTLYPSELAWWLAILTDFFLQGKMQASGSVCIKGPHESDISNQALRRHLILIFAKTYATVAKAPVAFGRYEATGPRAGYPWDWIVDSSSKRCNTQQGTSVCPVLWGSLHSKNKFVSLHTDWNANSFIWKTISTTDNRSKMPCFSGGRKPNGVQVLYIRKHLMRILI